MARIKKPLFEDEPLQNTGFGKDNVLLSVAAVVVFPVFLVLGTARSRSSVSFVEPISVQSSTGGLCLATAEAA
jgi:hypothetical protein